MKIRILPGEKYETLSKSKPEIGIIYNLEKASEGTAEQRRAFHALLNEYYKSGLWSYQGSGYNQGATLDEFKKMIKRKLGAGFESYIYVDIIDGLPKLFEVTKYEDVPAHIKQDKDKANYIRGRLKSYADYTKVEARNMMDNMISEMHQVGVKTAKFYEILEGMGNDNTYQ